MIVLDTHIWLWVAAAPGRLTSEQRRLVDEEDEPLGLSIISLWEAAMLAQRDRIAWTEPMAGWLDELTRNPRIVLIDLTSRIAAESVQLPEPFHRDPADRIIVATARVHGCPLMTVDREILDYEHVKTIA